MDTDQAFGQALRYWRMHHRWTQTALAQVAGMDRNYISLIELGRSSPSIRMVFRLCNALGVQPSELLRDAERRLAEVPNPDAPPPAPRASPA